MISLEITALHPINIVDVLSKSADYDYGVEMLNSFKTHNRKTGDDL